MDPQDLNLIFAVILAIAASIVSAPVKFNSAKLDDLRSAPALFPESATFAAALGKAPEDGPAP